MTTTTTTGTTLALKEWGAVAHAFLQGRQSLLLRKGGIHEKAFAVGEDRFVLFPTVAHSHAERVRPEHADLLEPGAADVTERPTGAETSSTVLTVRVGIELFDVVQVERPDNLELVEDLHIWTTESVRRDRVDFRPKHRLHALVVRPFALPQPVEIERRPEHGGCTSWVHLSVSWPEDAGPQGTGRQLIDDTRLAADARRVRDALG